MRKKTKINLSKAICYKFEASAPLTMKIKHRINVDFSTVTLKRKGRPGICRDLSLKVKEPEPQKIVYSIFHLVTVVATTTIWLLTE